MSTNEAQSGLNTEYQGITSRYEVSSEMVALFSILGTGNWLSQNENETEPAQSKRNVNMQLYLSYVTIDIFDHDSEYINELSSI